MNEHLQPYSGLVNERLLKKCVRNQVDSYGKIWGGAYSPEHLLKTIRNLVNPIKLKTRPITPEGASTEQALKRLFLRRNFDIGITIIQGAGDSIVYPKDARGMETDWKAHLAIERVNEAFPQILGTVSDYLLRERKKMFIASIPILSMASQHPPQDFLWVMSHTSPLIPLPLTIGVYPEYATYYAGRPPRYDTRTTAYDREQQRLGRERLLPGFHRLLPVKATVGSQPLDPQDSQYTAKVNAEWEACTKILCNVSGSLVKPEGKRITLLYNGGKSASQELALKLKQKERIIVLRESGRLADIVCALKEGKEIPHPHTNNYIYESFLAQLRKEFGDRVDPQAILKDIILVDVPPEPRFSSVATRMDQISAASEAVLEAILKD